MDNKCIFKYSIFLYLLVIMKTVFAEEIMDSSANISSVIQAYNYQDNQVYSIKTGLGLTTQIELGSDEKILDFSTGFSQGWELNRRENVFYLKPKNVDVDTNMVIRTETSSYLFELKVVATDWKTLEQAKSAGVHYKVVFKYPNKTSENVSAKNIDIKAEKEKSQLLNTNLQKERKYYYNYDYAIPKKKGTEWLVPISVYDDGKFTYIKMPDITNMPTGNFPAVFSRSQQHGEEFIVNTTIEESTIIVHGTYPYLVIRHGKDIVGLRRNGNL